MSAARPSSSTVRVLEREAAAIGARIAWEWGRKHAFAVVTMADGTRFTETVSRGPRDNRKLRVWFRQAVRRATDQLRRTECRE